MGIFQGKGNYYRTTFNWEIVTSSRAPRGQPREWMREYQDQIQLHAKADLISEALDFR